MSSSMFVAVINENYTNFTVFNSAGVAFFNFVHNFLILQQYCFEREKSYLFQTKN